MSQAAAMPHLLGTSDAPGKHVSLALTVAVHLALATFLIYGINWQTSRPETVEVELVSARPAPIPQPVVKPEPKPEPKVQPPIEEKRPPPPVKPDIALKEKEKPKPAKEEPRPKVDPFQELLRRDEERLAKNKEADAVSKELAQLKSAQAAAQTSSARRKAEGDYVAKIKGKIKGNIVRPDVTGNPEAVFEVTQLPSGEILSVKLKKSSGNQTLDTAIERAILKSSPLPKPDDPSVFQRALVLTFKPFED